MQSPLVRKSCLRVETLADLEGVGQRTAGTGNLFSHASEEDLTGFVPALQLRIWFFEVDHPVDVGVEATTLRAHHQHGASLEQVAVRDGMPVVAMRLSAAARSTGLRSPVAGRSPAGRRQVRGGLVLAHPRLQGARHLRHCRRGVGPNLPVSLQSVGVEGVGQDSGLP
jgi:hypothetical protein